MIGVEDQRLPIEGVPEGVGVARVPPLGHASSVAHDERFGRIEKIVEVIGAENFPVELLILDLVPPEVLRRRPGQRCCDDRQQSEEHPVVRR